MATRIKTIEYAFPFRAASVASGTRSDFEAITLYIPENQSRTFRSVFVEISVMDDVTSASSLTANLIGCKLGAAAFSDDSDTYTLPNNVENNAYKFISDFTSYFNTNFGAGTSQTCQVGVTLTGPSSVNLNAKIYLTYEYDDASQQTRVKTVRIPLESGLGALTTSLAELGTNQIPNLDSFLPESSKTYRNIWFELRGNTQSNGTTDSYLAFALDAESEVQSGRIEQALNSARYFELFWVRNDMATNATHAFMLRTTSLTGSEFRHLSVVLCVTYEYDHTSSTSILNSLVIPFVFQRGALGHTTSGDQSKERLKFFVEESSPSLVQSGFVLHWEQDNNYNLIVAAGAQSTRTYTNRDALYCGGLALSHRIDSGAGGGAGLTLARGENTLDIAIYTSTGSTYQPGALCGVLYLNYTSLKHASGADVHNHSVFWGLISKGSTNRTKIAAIAPIIPETNYWLTWAGAGIIANRHKTAMSLAIGAMLDCQRAAGEGVGAGWETILQHGGIGSNDQEAGITHFYSQTHSFRRHPSDPDANRLDVEGNRSFKWTSPGHDGGAFLWLTYHAITFAIAGTISGSGGGLVTIEAHRVTSGEKLASTSRIGNGAYAMTWYDDVESMFVQAREDATHVGRSDNTTAV